LAGVLALLQIIWPMCGRSVWSPVDDAHIRVPYHTHMHVLLAHQRYTSPHANVRTQLVHQEAHRPPHSMCIYSLCNRRHKYTSLLTHTCIHGWPTTGNTSPHINVHTWRVRQEVHRPPRMHVHAYTACAPKWVYAQTPSHMLTHRFAPSCLHSDDRLLHFAPGEHVGGEGERVKLTTRPFRHPCETTAPVFICVVPEFCWMGAFGA
jgi:hypothetical protein